MIGGLKMKSRVLVFTSGKGGVGKTTTTANLGLLCDDGQKVVLLDTDIRTPQSGCRNGLEIELFLILWMYKRKMQVKNRL
jgi:MinD-like ATPase involved in chromosome partitioning or flagellar assembly